MPSMRTHEMLEKYQKHRQANPATTHCPLCQKEPIKSYAHWKVTNNDFPYDVVAKTHHMILPLRHVTEEGLTEEEMKEFREIKSELIEREYDYIIEATAKAKSIPTHHHIHLIVEKH